MKKDSVWFTYKARIQAHKRLEWLDFHSQLLLVWYAILSTALGVLTIRHSTILGPDTDIMATILSVALLGISLAVANRDFRGRAMLMRTNYLELQKLHRGIPEGLPNAPPPAPTSDQIRSTGMTNCWLNQKIIARSMTASPAFLQVAQPPDHPQASSIFPQYFG